ncbi:hypothetical protein H4R19_006532 [Coemansia spiralis]|nr:hypothetical protein H4R19_006532 [Coemansia spiralis]
MANNKFISKIKGRLLRPGGPPLVFRVANIVVAILMIVSGIVFFTWHQFEHIMLGVFELLFGMWIIAIEFAASTQMARYVKFMFTWFGRGLFYVFIGCLTFGYKTFGWVLGAIITGVGAVYIVLAFTMKRGENYATSPDGARLSGEPMYDPHSVYGRKLDMYGSVVSVQQSMAQPHYPQQQQPQYTTSQYVPSHYNLSHSDVGQHQEPAQQQGQEPAQQQQQQSDRLPDHSHERAAAASPLNRPIL